MLVCISITLSEDVFDDDVFHALIDVHLGDVLLGHAQVITASIAWLFLIFTIVILGKD